MKISKKYKLNSEVISTTKSLDEYLSVLDKINNYKFDQTVELKIAVKRSNKNPQPYKISVVFPHSFGKETKILVLAEPKEAEEALKAGADYAGLDEYINKILNDNWFDFDIVIAHPNVMSKIAKLGKALGTKGLMPNPKNGTVTQDISNAVKEFKQGRKNFKEDKTGVINIVFGKVSQGKDKLRENLLKIIEEIKTSTPGIFSDIFSIHIKTTMTPSVKITKSEFMQLS
ncbi:MAG: 50S ribosomal protein L1 [Candidatus Dojkabacteria bacterium]|nr:50S ribosomal protein L1 [Candidatus Dojkabacteria bacterium]